jgi:hypothetical protein
MTEDQFWKLIEESRQQATDCESQTSALQKLLSKLSGSEIQEFHQIFTEKVQQAYRWDLWGVAELIKGFCSDDSFEGRCCMKRGCGG